MSMTRYSIITHVKFPQIQVGNCNRSNATDHKKRGKKVSRAILAAGIIHLFLRVDLQFNSFELKMRSLGIATSYTACEQRESRDLVV